ncbi:unnamed protein product [Boreogadus saida]
MCVSVARVPAVAGVASTISSNDEVHWCSERFQRRKPISRFKAHHLMRSAPVPGKLMAEISKLKPPSSV